MWHFIIWSGFSPTLLLMLTLYSCISPFLILYDLLSFYQITHKKQSGQLRFENFFQKFRNLEVLFQIASKLGKAFPCMYQNQYQTSYDKIFNSFSHIPILYHL